MIGQRNLNELSHTMTIKLFLFQTERSFQKQPTVFLNNKKNLLSTKGQKNTRHFKNVGLGFKTPREVRKLMSIRQCCPLL